MGKTKWSAETEDNKSQPGLRINPSVQRRSRASAPGRLYQEPAEPPSLEMVLRLFYLRLRRSWIAFRFQANRCTMGVFRKRTILKLGTLAVVGYMLLFSDRQFWLFSHTGVEDYVSVGPVETALEVTERPQGKSLNWDRATEPEQAPKEPKKNKQRRNTANEAAPISAFDLKTDQTEKYIARFSGIAVKEMHRYGIPASISLAQGLVESRYGTSKLAVRNNNHFGMKCFSKKCGKGHCSNFSDDHHKDFFRIFKTPWDSWRAHSEMLANGRYARLKKYGLNYRSWAHGLENLGYATDRSYAEKLIGVIERYDLDRFDR